MIPDNVRAVPVVVVGVRQAVDEVHEARDTLAVDHSNAGRSAVVAQVVVPGGDAGVDDRHADAGAVIAPRLLRRAGAHGHGRAAHVARELSVVVHHQDFRTLGNLLDDTIRQLDGHAVDELQPAADTATELLDFLLGVGLVPWPDREDHLGSAEQLARARRHFSVELLEPLLPAGVVPAARARLGRQQLVAGA